MPAFVRGGVAPLPPQPPPDWPPDWPYPPGIEDWPDLEQPVPPGWPTFLPPGNTTVTLSVTPGSVIWRVDDTGDPEDVDDHVVTFACTVTITNPDRYKDHILAVKGSWDNPRGHTRTVAAAHRIVGGAGPEVWAPNLGATLRFSDIDSSDGVMQFEAKIVTASGAPDDTVDVALLGFDPVVGVALACNGATMEGITGVIDPTEGFTVDEVIEATVLEE